MPRSLLLFLGISCIWCLSACSGSRTPTPAPLPTPTPPTLTGIVPSLGDPLGGLVITLTGTHLEGATVSIGDQPCSELEFPTSTTLRCRTPELPSGTWDVEVETEDGIAILHDAYEAWSPADLPGARLFDVASGVESAGATTRYEWQRLTAEIHPDWRVRDGNTTTWLPSTGKFWLIGGWNGYQEPVGFSAEPEGLNYPFENTSNEVWSSPDGIQWTLELPHRNTVFERRHIHNTVLFQDKLWVIGGDSHQGYYNHDVLSSSNGRDWTTHLGPGTTRPPWSPRTSQISGVFAGKLWTGGGQDTLGLQDEWVYHNDLWNSEDGIHWTQVAADAPASATRWAGRSMVDGFVEFKGRMWLLSGGRYRDDGIVATSMFRDVWSTADGITWQQHAEPPWMGKTWPNVVVWDDKLWILFGYTYGDAPNGWTAGNANEVWYTEDGDHWRSLPVDAPVPGSHGQGVAVTDAAILLAGGNYSFGYGAGVDKSVWRLVPKRGAEVTAWTDRGSDARRVEALTPEARPLFDPDGLAEGVPGLHFDGSFTELQLTGEDDAQASGRSVFWIARMPYLPGPYGWDETYAPVGTILGGPDATGLPNSSIGLSDGQVVCANREAGLGEFGEPLWARVEGGEGLQQGPGGMHLVGMTHAIDGTVQVWVDGQRVESSGIADYSTPRSWSRIGGSMDGWYYGPHSRFAGTLGMLLVLPEVADEATVRKIARWAHGRFGPPRDPEV